MKKILLLSLTALVSAISFGQNAFKEKNELTKSTIADKKLPAIVKEKNNPAIVDYSYYYEENHFRQTTEINTALGVTYANGLDSGQVWTYTVKEKGAGANAYWQRPVQGIPLYDTLSLNKIYFIGKGLKSGGSTVKVSVFAKDFTTLLGTTNVTASTSLAYQTATFASPIKSNDSVYVVFDMNTVADSFQIAKTNSYLNGLDVSFISGASSAVTYNATIPFLGDAATLAYAPSYSSFLGSINDGYDFYIVPMVSYTLRNKFSVNDNNICVGDSVTFTSANGHLTNPIFSYFKWSQLVNGSPFLPTKYNYDANAGSTFTTSTTLKGGKKYTTAGTFTAKAIASISAWTISTTQRDTATFTITVNAIPSAPVIAATGGTPTIGGAIGVCGGSSATISVNSPGAGTYAWSNAGSGSSINTSTAATYTVTNTANGCTSPASNAVTIVNCSELNENASSVFSVYPNPANDILNVELNVENAVITLVSTEGKVIETRNASNAVETLNVKGLNAGVYFLNINANNNTYNQKVIIK